MTEGRNLSPVWWDIVKLLAELIAGSDEDILGDDEVYQYLLSCDYREKDINRAYQWFHQVSRSGTLSESIAMLVPSSDHTRITNPIEMAYMSPDLWHQIDKARQRGFLSDDFAERLLEGVRTIDTRDWDEVDISHLLGEVMAMSFPSYTVNQCLEILSGAHQDFYC